MAWTVDPELLETCRVQSAIGTASDRPNLAIPRTLQSQLPASIHVLRRHAIASDRRSNIAERRPSPHLQQRWGLDLPTRIGREPLQFCRRGVIPSAQQIDSKHHIRTRTGGCGKSCLILCAVTGARRRAMTSVLRNRQLHKAKGARSNSAIAERSWPSVNQAIPKIQCAFNDG